MAREVMENFPKTVNIFSPVIGCRVMDFYTLTGMELVLNSRERGEGVLTGVIRPGVRKSHGQ